MSREKSAVVGLVVGLGAALALLVAGLWFVLRSDPTTPAGEDVPVEVAAPEPAQPDLGAVADLPAQVARDQPTETESSGGAPPESYRNALGGLRGRILEADLSPAVDLPVAAVEFLPQRFLLEPSFLLDDEADFPELVVASAQTDSEGRFVLAGLEPDGFQILGVDLGGPRSTFRILDQTPRSGEIVDIGDVVLEPYVTFLGRVIDENGRPVPGARIRATNLPNLIFQFGIQYVRPDSAFYVTEIAEDLPLFEIPPFVARYESLLPIPTTITDSEGCFRLPGVPQGLISVVADKAGHLASVKGPIPSGRRPERDIGDVVIADGFLVRGRVLETAGRPVAGAEVRAGIRSPTLPVPVVLMQPGGITDVTGSFEVPGLPPGSDAFVAVRRGRSRPWEVFGPYPSGTEELLVRLEAPLQVEVRLLTDAGEPISQARLYVAVDMQLPVPPLLAPPLQRVESTLLEEGLVRLEGLDPGRYLLVGRAEGYAQARLSIDALPQSEPYDLVFPPAHTVDVTVRGAGSGEPVEWAFVSIAPDGILERPVDRSRTDEEGLARLEGIEAGAYELTVQHPALASQSLKLQVPSDPLEVQLPEGGHLRGRVHVAGEPPDASLLIVAGMNRPTGIDVVPTFTVTATTGDFFVPNLQAGEYWYAVRDRVVGKGPLALFQTFQDDSLAEGGFEIREGETTELEIDVDPAGQGPVGFLTGLVTIHGVPAEGLSVRYEGRRSRSAETDDQGFFDLGPVSSGNGRLTVQKLESGNFMSLASSLHEERMTLQEGEQRHVQIDLELGSVAGRVRGPSVLPLGPGTVILLEREEGNSRLVGGTNPLTGSFEFDSVPYGSWRLRVRKQGFAPASQSFELSRAQPRAEIDLQLQSPTVIAGFLLLPAGVDLRAEPPPRERRGRRRGPPPQVGSFLMLVDEDGERVGGGRVDPDTLEFEIDDGFPGRFRARLFTGGRRLRSAEFEVPPGGIRDLELTMEEEGTGEDGGEDGGRR